MSIIDAFLDALWLEQGASDHTLAAYRRDLTAWQAHLERHGEALLAPPPDRLSEWLDQTAGRRLSTAQQCPTTLDTAQLLPLGASK